jgi:GNAT superfamily N-acetyltransferase
MPRLSGSVPDPGPSSEFSLRVADPGDRDAVASVLEASYPVLMADAYPPTLLEKVRAAITRANPRLLASGSYYIVESGDMAVGCGGWTHEEPGGGSARSGIAHLRHFAARADWSGRGIGRLIYERCEEDARRAGVRTLECWASLNGEGFYAALGFASLGPIDVVMDGGVVFPSIRMRRRL